MNDFTLTIYTHLLQTIQKKELPIYGVSNWIKAKPEKGVVIRHDVDRRPKNALKMAKIEAAAGIFTTYYFGVVGSAYDTNIICAVSDLGHEVGYHYEDLAIAKGNIDLAEKLFKGHLTKLREIVPINTVAMHGSPLSSYNNLEIWKKMTLSEHELLGEAFLSIDYDDIYYFTDTGRAWNSSKDNYRDRPLYSLSEKYTQLGTKGLIDFIKNKNIKKISISAHPERWNDTILGWYYQAVLDNFLNSAKRVISYIRK